MSTTINPDGTPRRCAICLKPDLRRMVELAWNGKMSAPAISAVFGNIPSQATILKHLNEHVDDGAASRAIPVPEARTMRERVTDVQRVLIEEFERRIVNAQERAAWWNAHPLEADGWEPRDWSYYFDVLDKDLQSSVNSIMKMQGLTDKREIGKAQVGVDLAKLMLGGGDGLAPRRLTAGRDESDEPVEGEFKEAGDGGPAE